MNRMRQRHSVSPVLLLAIVLLGAVTPAYADYYDHKGTFMLGGGWNSTTGQTANYLDGGGTLFFAGGRHLNESTALQIEYSHHWLGVDPSVVDRANSDSLQFDNAYSSMWSVTLNGVYRHNPRETIVPWVTGGFGFNVGLGFDFQIDSGASLYVDARYHHAYMAGVDMDVIPISFGIRW